MLACWGTDRCTRHSAGRSSARSRSRRWGLGVGPSGCGATKTFRRDRVAPVTLVVAERAATSAANYRIRGCDAVYIALADQLGEHLATLDRQQLERGATIVSAHEP